MEDEWSWADLKGWFAEIRDDLPQPSEIQTKNLKSIGEALPALLADAEEQHAEVLDEALVERLAGLEWPEGLTPAMLMCLEIRLQWTAAVMDSLEASHLPVPPPDFLADLVVLGWSAGGYGHSHDNYLQRLLLEVRADTLEEGYGIAGG